MDDHTVISKRVLAEWKAEGTTPIAEIYQSVLHSFMFEGIDDFMKMLSPEDRQEFMYLANDGKIDSISDNNLKNYIQVSFDEKPIPPGYNRAKEIYNQAVSKK